MDELSLVRPRTGSQGRTQLLVLRAACSEAGRGWVWVTTTPRISVKGNWGIKTENNDETAIRYKRLTLREGAPATKREKDISLKKMNNTSIAFY